MENRSEKTFGSVTIIERSDWTCGIIDAAGEIVVPFGKYDWIDGFDHGLARVRTEGLILCDSKLKDVTDPATLKTAIKKDGEIYARWGIINQKGEEVIPVNCDYIEAFCCKRKLTTTVVKNGSVRKVCCFDSTSCKTVRSEKNFGNVTVIQNSDYQWCVVNAEGKMVTPFGKYDWIDDFDQGLARVKIGNVPNNIEDNGNKWGIINEKGEEVLPVEYDSVWKFAGKNRFSTKVEKGGFCHEVYLHKLNPTLPVRGKTMRAYHDVYDNVDESDEDYGYGSHYGDFAGTYAQDVAGFSDDVIYDVFEGDPDAYWNID